MRRYVSHAAVCVAVWCFHILPLKTVVLDREWGYRSGLVGNALAVSLDKLLEVGLGKSWLAVEVSQLNRYRDGLRRDVSNERGKVQTWLTENEVGRCSHVGCH